MTFPKKESFEVVVSSSHGNAATTGHLLAFWLSSAQAVHNLGEKTF